MHEELFVELISKPSDPRLYLGEDFKKIYAYSWSCVLFPSDSVLGGYMLPSRIYLKLFSCGTLYFHAIHCNFSSIYYFLFFFFLCLRNGVSMIFFYKWRASSSYDWSCLCCLFYFWRNMYYIIVIFNLLI